MDLPARWKDRLQQQLGADYPAFRAAMAEPGPTSLRKNPAKVPEASWATGDDVRWCPAAQLLPQRPAFVFDPRWHAGAYYVQEANSMLVGWAAQRLLQKLPTVAPLVLDLCAAPGGKTTHLLAELPVHGAVLANELQPKRAAVLRENLAKWGDERLLTTNTDSSALARALPGSFQLVVLDAPCSGEGLLRRQPEDVLGQWSEALIESCAATQLQLLQDAWQLLAPGGYLLYSTCSFAPAENEDLLDRFLAETDRAKSLDLDLPAAWGWEAIAWRTGMGYRAWPHRTPGDGLFLAALQKTGTSPDPPDPFALPALQPKSLPDDWHDFLPEAFAAYLQRDEGYSLQSPSVRYLAEQLSASGLSHQAGLPLLRPDKNRLAPAPHWALWRHLPHNKRLRLSRPDALRYLKGEALRLPDAGAGWQIADYQGHALGWVKVGSGRANNHLPKPWRIRVPLPSIENLPALPSLG